MPLYDRPNILSLWLLRAEKAFPCVVIFICMIFSYYVLMVQYIPKHNMYLSIMMLSYDSPFIHAIHILINHIKRLSVVSFQCHIKPPRTTLPTPATSLFTPPLLLSSNSFTTPCTMIFRTLASAFVNISATTGLHSLGEATKLISFV